RIYLTEKIGNPELFTGRRNELTFFLEWCEGVKGQFSKSTAILSRRKTGKTALLQRLYNILFDCNDPQLIPFYFEVEEGPKWAVDFCAEFFMIFMTQYLAFKTRNPYLFTIEAPDSFDTLNELAVQEGCAYLQPLISKVARLVEQERVDRLWTAVRNAPRFVADSQNERIVQIVDEFQYLNSEIYRDRATTQVANDFAAGYMSTAEYRNAPLLISGSWVGWLRDLLHTMLPSRFKHYFLEEIPDSESLEMVFKYAQLLNVAVTEESAYLLARISEGNPFYIGALFYSMYPGKDFRTQEGILRTLEFETLDDRGDIKSTWWEYLVKIFGKGNEGNAKNIVLYLSKHREREVTRKELLNDLRFDMSDGELEQKLHALVRSDIIEQGRSNFYYRGVQDNIFDKVFRGMYADDIQDFDPQEIRNEYKALYDMERRKFRRLLGKFNDTKGYLAEYLIINQLRFHASQQSDVFMEMTHNLPKDFRFVNYESVWKYKTIPRAKQELEIDIFARAPEGDYSLIWEVKNRDSRKFSVEEAEAFLRKTKELQKMEQVSKALACVFSLSGFSDGALQYCRAHGIAWSDDLRWLEEN
ncbi:MAG: hypothetical protein GY801_50355, partial [bacterium]|nr:hypothetical protein [bacterium]